MNEITINKYLIKVLTIAFVIGSSASARCPTQEETVNLDLQKFSGVWHIIATTPPPGIPKAKCANVSISSTDSDSFTMVYKKINPDGPITIFATARRNSTGDFVATYRTAERDVGIFVQRIIEIDYTSHFVMIGCNTNPAPGRNPSPVLINSRQKTLSSEVLEQLKSKARAYIDSDTAIVDGDNSDCDLNNFSDISI